MRPNVLVLWDIDRTLLYVGDVDQQIYLAIFHELVGRAPVILPERGTGVTTPVVLRRLFADNGVPPEEVAILTERATILLPTRLAERPGDLVRQGQVMASAVEALQAVAVRPELIQTVFTRNLRGNAVVKLAAFGLNRCLDLDVGAFAPDDDCRPNLVAVAQRRASARYRSRFVRANTVIIGDSCEDVRTAHVGGSSVICVESGTTASQQFCDAGADVVLTSLSETAVVLSAIDALTSRLADQPGSEELA